MDFQEDPEESMRNKLMSLMKQRYDSESQQYCAGEQSSEVADSEDLSASLESLSYHSGNNTESQVRQESAKMVESLLCLAASPLGGDSRKSTAHRNTMRAPGNARKKYQKERHGNEFSTARE